MPELKSTEMHNATIRVDQLSDDSSSVYQVVVCPLNFNKTNITSMTASPLELRIIDHQNITTRYTLLTRNYLFIHFLNLKSHNTNSVIVA